MSHGKKAKDKFGKAAVFLYATTIQPPRQVQYEAIIVVYRLKDTVTAIVVWLRDSDRDCSQK